MDSEKIRLVEAARLLEDRLRKADATIRFQSTMITIIGVLVGIVTIGIPIAGYFFVVREQDKLTDTIRENVTEYIEKDRTSRTDSAIAGIESGDGQRRIVGLTWLQFNQTVPLTNQQVEKLIAAVRKPHNTNFQSSIIYILAFRPSATTDRYFAELLRNEVTGREFTSSVAQAIYLSGSAPIQRIESLFDASRFKQDFFNALVQGARMYSGNVDALYYSKDIVDQLFDEVDNTIMKSHTSKADIKMAYQNIMNVYENNSQLGEVFKRTYFNQVGVLRIENVDAN